MKSFLGPIDTLSIVAMRELAREINVSGLVRRARAEIIHFVPNG
jgi:hypothetical protein